jgi:hypothetical protein
MELRILSHGAIAAVAGAAMLATASGPSDAFTLSAPSLTPSVATADVQPAYWGWGWHHRWHRWHHWGWGPRWGWYGGWHRWGWGPRYAYGPRCWWTAWGSRRCTWV